MIQDAATITGLDLLRFFNEPTADSITYGIDKMRPFEKFTRVRKYHTDEICPWQWPNESGKEYKAG